MAKLKLYFALSILALLLSSSRAHSDRGMLAPAGTSVWEPGQKAIIAWNGEREVLILSTDVRSSESTWALEILPLPSRPEVEAGDFSSFLKLQRILDEYVSLAYAAKGLEGGSPVQVVFSQRIGSHGITVVEAGDAAGLARWVENYLAEKGLEPNIAWADLLELADAYIRRGMRYWVFDLVDLGEDMGSREPIVYSFESDFLYYPLEISSLASGSTEVTLFCLTNKPLDVGVALPADLTVASFEVAGDRIALELEVSEIELTLIDRRVAGLFDDGAKLTVLTYEGPLTELRGDLALYTTPSGEDQMLAAAWAALLILGLFLAFGVVYWLSPYYKSEPAG
ncbi:MAG: DUF2330 domain-containing protein [Hadesarchaea archaeon]|nr:DUF2330 domain-containing protein [Hadesarchaea archaeon]